MKDKERRDLQKEIKNNKWHQRFMSLAEVIASWSNAKRLCVGSVVVKNGFVVAQGFNGTLPKTDNECEDNEGITKITCVHSEMNALTYMAREGIATKGCSLYVTTNPCINCSLLIAACGIKEVFYRNEYKDTRGFEILKLAKIKVKKI